MCSAVHVEWPAATCVLTSTLTRRSRRRLRDRRGRMRVTQPGSPCGAQAATVTPRSEFGFLKHSLLAQYTIKFNSNPNPMRILVCRSSPCGEGVQSCQQGDNRFSCTCRTTAPSRVARTFRAAVLRVLAHATWPPVYIVHECELCTYCRGRLARRSLRRASPLPRGAVPTRWHVLRCRRRCAVCMRRRLARRRLRAGCLNAGPLRVIPMRQRCATRVRTTDRHAHSASHRQHTEWPDVLRLE